MERLLSHIDTLFFFFEQPGQAHPKIQRERPYLLSFLCILGTCISMGLAQGLLFPYSLPRDWNGLLLWGTLVWGLHLFFWVFLTGWLHLFAEIAGGKGRAEDLFNLMALSELPWTLILPWVLTAQAFSSSPKFYAFLSLPLLAGWSLRLKARSLRQNYQLDWLHSWTVLGVPYLTCFLVFLSLGLLALLAAFLGMKRLIA